MLTLGPSNIFCRQMFQQKKLDHVSDVPQTLTNQLINFAVKVEKFMSFVCMITLVG